ncbi:polysaccharide deacetylase family protein, partial [bacterium]|nr:polysaccharide deacetylase family protein [bacterium]
KIKGGDFRHKDSYEEFSLRVWLREPRGLIEFRVVSYGQVNIKVDRISLRLLNRQELLSGPRYIPILMYHKISKDAPTAWWVRTRDFRRQIREVKRAGYKTIRLKDIYDHKSKKASLPFHPIVVSFDDGYYNFLTDAFPILEEYGFTATLFIITDRIADNEAGRMDNSWDQESESKYRAEHLIWPEIQWLAKKGMEIGSHTRTHPNLTRLKKPDFEKEIKESKAIIEDKLGVPVESFCYPGGKRNALIVEAVRDAGYKGAVTTYPGIENSEKMDLFNLKRIYVRPRQSSGKLLLRLAER